MIYTTKVFEDSDGYQCLEFSDEMMEALDLKIGDQIVWEQNKITGQWSFRKADGSSDTE
jgi:hypothetical protein